MTTSSYGSFPKPILKIRFLLHAGLLKIFPYLCPVSWWRKTYTKTAWYRKHVAIELADLCDVESNVVVVLNHVTDAAVAVLQRNGCKDFEDYDGRE